jgi:hypothetical protein
MLIAASVICWLFGLAFLVIAFRAIHKDKWGLAGTGVSLCAVFILCGQPWFQGLAKTWIVSHVGERLSALSKQMDEVQGTTTKMQSELADHQNQLSNHQNEIDFSQAKLRTNQAEVANQQSKITNQYREIRQMELKVASAQGDLEAQSKKIQDVEFLVGNLFSKTVTDLIHGSDSDRVKIRKFKDGASQVFLVLTKIPIQKSLQGVGKGPSGQFPLIGLSSTWNVAIATFGRGDPASVDYTISYVQDTRETNKVKTIEMKDEEVYFDTHRIVFEAGD